MSTIEFEDITDSILARISDYDWLNLTEDEISEFLVSWIKMSCSNPYIRRIFSSFSIDEDMEEISFTMRNAIDDDFDEMFVKDILAIGAVIQWLNPQINSTLNTHQVYASKEEKYYSQAAHILELRNMKHDLIVEQRRMISDRGNFNSYLDSDV